MKTIILSLLIIISIACSLGREIKHHKHHKKHRGRRLKKREDKPKEGGASIEKKAENKNLWMGSCLVELLGAKQTDNFDMCKCTYTMSNTPDG